jgi:hypothetical protein
MALFMTVPFVAVAGVAAAAARWLVGGLLARRGFKNMA